MTDSLKAKTPLRLANVSKSFDGNKVLDGVDLELAAGSITGLLGRNGSGKTTLIRAAVGLLEPEEGDAFLYGYRAWDCPASVRRRIGYVAQTFDDMLSQKVGVALELVGSFYDTWDYKLVERFKEEWDVPDDKVINTLSIGQQQKVGILLALGHRPELLILDEPVASLDPVARQNFIRTLLMLNDEIGQTILFSSHITTDIERIAADVAILNQGKVTWHGSLAELKEKVQCVFLRADFPIEKLNHIDGVISSRVDGNRVQVWVRDWSDDQSQKLGEEIGKAGDSSIHVESVGLEELFTGMTS